MINFSKIPPERELSAPPLKRRKAGSSPLLQPGTIISFSRRIRQICGPGILPAEKSEIKSARGKTAPQLSIGKFGNL